MRGEPITILDVGCGSRPRGTVNVDRFTGRTAHHKHDINPREIPNFITADAQHLPIRDNAVDILHSSNVLEHLVQPYQALREFTRVSRKVVILRVPNNPVFKESRSHLYSWSTTTLRNLLRLVFPRVTVTADTTAEQLRQSRLIRPLLNVGLFKRPLARIFARLTRVEIHATCWVKR